MRIERQYQETLPFAWKEDGRGESDRNWLQDIVETTPPFSDRWTKARIVQLAHQLDSEEKIANSLRTECDLEQYLCFEKTVDEEYVINTLNDWKNQKFRQSVGRNFEIFICQENSNAFLVVSRITADDVKSNIPPLERFRPLFNVDELAVIIKDNDIKRLTLRTHGYGTSSEGFYDGFYREVNNLKNVAANKHIYIGYNWPSEAPLAIFGTWFDWLKKVSKTSDIYFKFALVLSVSSIIIGSLSNGLLQTLKWLFSWQFFSLQPQWIGLISFVFVFWSLAFYLLREVAYQGDRTRAIYYGIPDLAEFFSRLDRGLYKLTKSAVLQPLQINIIGHSMGGFVVLNAISLLRYHFRYDEEKPNKFGEHFQLDKLILASPDVPLELLRQGRNNYLRTAFNCSEQIYLMSSDRDIVLRYLSTVGNWFSEPSIPMSGLRLGNVYLPKQGEDKPEPCIRILFNSQKLKQPKADLELFDKLNYLDCSEMKVADNRGGVNFMKLPLNSYNGLAIDLGNIIFGNLAGVDLHGGYFQKHTPSFAILNLLLATDLNKKGIEAEIEKIIENSSIRFLASQD
ncbi:MULTISPECIES: alpha/beta hydrolase [Aerosakkonema]|uniref:alpha/beta hydrolase n=1 Tax=Aerosakkonema TaxID=1246629 RepID=UPI0035B9EED7